MRHCKSIIILAAESIFCWHIVRKEFLLDLWQNVQSTLFNCLHGDVNIAWWEWSPSLNDFQGLYHNSLGTLTVALHHTLIKRGCLFRVTICLTKKRKSSFDYFSGPLFLICHCSMKSSTERRQLLWSICKILTPWILLVYTYSYLC